MAFDFILIAASTGGPAALNEVCSGLPDRISCPVLIVQHMPPDFTRLLAGSLSKVCKLPIEEATNGQTVLPGHILVAPGGWHMTVKNERGRKTVELLNTPLVKGVRPAADVLFDSIARSFPRQKILAVILTGMGNDGLDGVRRMKEACNCYCLAQSEESSVIYGMPRSVVDAGLADEVIHLKDMAKRIHQLVPFEK
ncbi:MAG: CheB methylesterase domain-containing protein [Sporomusaceae bacterium]|nr:CheB methylesterase domain-containing protein [Sporomusaceae bacterium]